MGGKADFLLGIALSFPYGLLADRYVRQGGNPFDIPDQSSRGVNPG